VNSYRFLLNVYPPGVRRAELLDTLTAGGRTRPTSREVANLLRFGMRARLGRPASRGIVVIAILFTFATAFAMAAVTERVGWQAVPAFPAGARLAAIEETVYPGSPHVAQRYISGGGLYDDNGTPDHWDVLVGGHNEDYTYASLNLLAGENSFLPGDDQRWISAAQKRIADAGWKVRWAGDYGGNPGDGVRAFATRGDVSLEIDTATNMVGTPAGAFGVTTTLRRVPPLWLSLLAWAGALVGAPIGWLLTGWASRRTEHGRPGVRRALRIMVSVALAGVAPQSIGGLQDLAAETSRIDPPDRPFWAATLAGGWSITQCAMLLSLVCLLIAARSPRRPEAFVTVQPESQP
jgi:hypothetical protein